MPRDPKQRDRVNDYEKKLLRTIDEFGWQVTSVMPREGDKGHAWSYSTGIFYHFRHPEIIVFNEATDPRHSPAMKRGEPD